MTAAPMITLYKYLHKQHAFKLLQEGEFRIGTLSSYRKTEADKRGIGDPDEGTKTLYM